MNRGQKAGDKPIAIDVEQGKSYYWCSCGKSSKQPFCDGSIKGLNLIHRFLKPRKQKKCFFALVSKQIINHFVMDLTVKVNK